MKNNNIKQPKKSRIKKKISIKFIFSKMLYNDMICDWFNLQYIINSKKKYIYNYGLKNN